ncbi:MAG: fused MFS/spermidine synthase, partial [Candidatus Omnitrophica bacterium]|nr:fused MFS/spermidine synthase [Candidatus Omnitrophota bacterium]
MRQLRLLLGSTAQAVSLVLAAFFLGIALGNHWWGKRVGRSSNPLRIYAGLELAVGLLAVGLYGLSSIYETLFPHVLSLTETTGIPILFFKFVLGMAFLLPPCFFMGGTFPAMTQHLYAKRTDLGRGGALLYGMNTLGGACGAFCSGFLLLGWIGFRACYVVGVLLSLGIAAVGFALSLQTRTTSPDHNAENPFPTRTEGGPNPKVPPWGVIKALAFASGFATLALEVLWTRMFEQVLHNSVYTFSLILVAFLVSIGIGGGIASYLARIQIEPTRVLVAAGCVAGLTTGLTPFLFTEVTGGLGYLGESQGWWGYVGTISRTMALTVLIPGIAMGSFFPYLLKMAEPHTLSTGKTAGILTSINTVGGVLGSLAGAFFFLEVFGLWNGIRAVGSIYFWMALVAGVHLLPRNRAGTVVPVGGILLLLMVLNPAGLPMVKVSRDKEILDYWEGSAGTVAVVESPKTRSILVNNYYTLGGRLAKKYQETMSHIPLLAHPDPESVFYIGMGTGITAAGSMVHPVEKVTICEIIPEAVEASRQYFHEDVRGLFEDSRVEIVVEDGRLFLAASDRRYDVIIGDLFIPWKAGTGNLYSLENYRSGFRHLKEGGVYAQWIPLYQVSDFELGVIAETMLEVFPAVSVWRGDFFAEKSIVLLLGHKQATAFDPDRINARAEQLSEETVGFPLNDPKDFWMHYCGSMSRENSPFDEYPINRDDLPIIEYTAPITMRKERAGETEF